VAERLPPIPEGLPPDTEPMRETPSGWLWFVPSFGNYGAVYIDAADGVRFAEAREMEIQAGKFFHRERKQRQRQLPGKEAKVATATKTESKAPKSEFAKLLEDGSDRELHAFLTKSVTRSDASWKSRAGRKTRKDGESRQAFLDRVLLGKSS
jgi:hypothetical protein